MNAEEMECEEKEYKEELLFFRLTPLIHFSMFNKDFFKEEKVSHWVMVYSCPFMPLCPSSSTTCSPDEFKFSMLA